MQLQSTYKSLRQPRVAHWAGIEWPVNEILLQSLVARGKSDRQIAELCGVETENVIRLRQDYGL